jgi:hypothetical protein
LGIGQRHEELSVTDLIEIHPARTEPDWGKFEGEIRLLLDAYSRRASQSNDELDADPDAIKAMAMILQRCSALDTEAKRAEYSAAHRLKPPRRNSHWTQPIVARFSKPVPSRSTKSKWVGAVALALEENVAPAEFEDWLDEHGGFGGAHKAWTDMNKSEESRSRNYLEEKALVERFLSAAGEPPSRVTLNDAVSRPGYSIAILDNDGNMQTLRFRRVVDLGSIDEVWAFLLKHARKWEEAEQTAPTAEQVAA